MAMLWLESEGEKYLFSHLLLFLIHKHERNKTIHNSLHQYQAIVTKVTNRFLDSILIREKLISSENRSALVLKSKDGETEKKTWVRIWCRNRNKREEKKRKEKEEEEDTHKDVFLLIGRARPCSCRAQELPVQRKRFRSRDGGGHGRWQSSGSEETLFF